MSAAFAEDPVRILRLARFAARFAPLGFEVASETSALMVQMTQAGEVDALVAERVWQELSQALSEPRPEVFFTVLRQVGALKVLLPALDALFQPLAESSEKERKESAKANANAGQQTLCALQHSVEQNADGPTRFACLCHQLDEATEPLCRGLKAPKRFTELALLVSRYHALCHRVRSLDAEALLRFLLALDPLRKPERLEQFLSACQAIAQADPELSKDGDSSYPAAEYVQGAYACLKALNTREIAEKAPSPSQIKATINAAQHQALEHYIRQHREPNTAH